MANTTSTAVAGPLALLYAADVARWYEDMTPHLHRFIASFGPVSAREAEDVIQDVFVRVIAHAAQLAQYTAEQRRRYVLTIAENVNRERFRQWIRRHELAHESYLSEFADPRYIAAVTPADASAEWLAHAQPNAQPEQTTAARMTLRAVWDATPSEYRELLVMVANGYNRQEIAAALGISEQNVSTRIWRMRQVLLEAGERIA